MMSPLTKEELRNAFIEMLEGGQFGFPAYSDFSWIRESIKMDMERLGIPYENDHDGFSYDTEYSERLLDEILEVRDDK